MPSESGGEEYRLPLNGCMNFIAAMTASKVEAMMTTTLILSDIYQ